MDPRLSFVPFAEVRDEASFGGKATSLGTAVRAGLPVPPGAALSVAFTDAVASGDGAAITALLASPHVPGGRLAVRSSAVGEDSSGSSFAGQHLTCLNVLKGGLVAAVRMVWESGHAPSALAYRAKRGITTPPRVAVVVQQLLDPITAGVLFTRDPVSGADEIVIEATWGLGEAIVNGLVVPDRWRLDREGRLLEHVTGQKDLRITRSVDQGTVEEEVPEERQSVPSLAPAEVAQLFQLVERCRGVWGDRLDIEWALADDGVVRLLQCRPITTSPVKSA